MLLPCGGSRLCAARAAADLAAAPAVVAVVVAATVAAVAAASAAALAVATAGAAVGIAALLGGFHGGYWLLPRSYGFRGTEATTGLILLLVGFGYWLGFYGYDYYSTPMHIPTSAYSYPAYSTRHSISGLQRSRGYPQSARQRPTNIYVERASPAMREYDEYGQETAAVAAVHPPIYLIAFKDHSIRAASAYWVDNATLHYVTPQNEQKQAPLDAVDRDFSMQLDRERRVQFSLPAAQ
jgi:hypothetical protein